MLRPPVEIMQYIDYEEGKVIISEYIPKDLKEMAEKYKAKFEELTKNELSEY